MRALIVFPALASLLLIHMFSATPACTEMYLEFWKEDEGGPAYCMPIREGCRFHFDFVNSIYLMHVRETFLFDRHDGFILAGIESPSPGVFEYYGLPTDGTGKAEMRRRVGHHVRLRSRDYRNHRITVDGTFFTLGTMFRGGETVIIQAGSCSR